MELEEAIKILEEFLLILGSEYCYIDNRDTTKEEQAIERVLKYIIEESIPKEVVEEKIKAILKDGKNMTEEERQKETMFLQGKLIALEELLNKGESDEN